MNLCVENGVSNSEFILINSSFARTLFGNTKPQRGVTMVASRFNGWYIAARKKRAFRYATLNPCREPCTLSVNILITSH